MEPYIDGYAPLTPEMVAGESCEGVEVSFMDGQRAWRLWLSRHDHLPRRLEEVVRVDPPLMNREVWSRVTVGAAMPETLFGWSPPTGWAEWTPPGPEAPLLKRGVPAPDFSLPGLHGETIRLSALRGQVVVLVIWRVGCQPCREVLPDLQRLSQAYRARGVTFLGLNYADEPERVQTLFAEAGVTFPTVLDPSPAGIKTVFEDYRAMAVPTYYLIGWDGRVRAAWVADDVETLERLLAEEAGG